MQHTCMCRHRGMRLAANSMAKKVNTFSPFFQGTTANMQTFFLELLSTDGRSLVMSIMAQKKTLYPPGAEPLKCIVTNYSSLTGSDKWVLASFMLFVFKPVLQDLPSMVRDVLLCTVVGAVGLSYLLYSRYEKRRLCGTSTEHHYKLHFSGSREYLYKYTNRLFYPHR